MKNIYNAPNKEVAATELDNLEKNGEERMCQNDASSFSL